MQENSGIVQKIPNKKDAVLNKIRTPPQTNPEKGNYLSVISEWNSCKDLTGSL